MGDATADAVGDAVTRLIRVIVSYDAIEYDYAWVLSSSVVAVDRRSVWIPGLRGCCTDGSCEVVGVEDEAELLELLGWPAPEIRYPP